VWRGLPTPPIMTPCAASGHSLPAPALACRCKCRYGTLRCVVVPSPHGGHLHWRFRHLRRTAGAVQVSAVPVDVSFGRHSSPATAQAAARRLGKRRTRSVRQGRPPLRAAPLTSPMGGMKVDMGRPWAWHQAQGG
jgi:hypothetical protein